MKIKEFKHYPVFWDNNNRTNCILGNLSIVFVDGSYRVECLTKDKYQIYFKYDKEDVRTYNSIAQAKLDVQRMCNDFLQQALGFLDSGVKYELDGL